MRARDLGIRIGRMQPGPNNAITDVAGVRVGHTTLIDGDGPLRVGQGPVRTGVTVVIPHDGDIWTEPIFAGAHRLNGKRYHEHWLHNLMVSTSLMGFRNHAPAIR